MPCIERLNPESFGRATKDCAHNCDFKVLILCNSVDEARDRAQRETMGLSNFTEWGAEFSFSRGGNILFAAIDMLDELPQIIYNSVLIIYGIELKEDERGWKFENETIPFYIKYSCPDDVYEIIYNSSAEETNHELNNFLESFKIRGGK